VRVLNWRRTLVNPRVPSARARYPRLRSRRRSQSMTVETPSTRKLRLTTACTTCSAPVIDITLPPVTQEKRHSNTAIHRQSDAISFSPIGWGSADRYDRGGPGKAEEEVSAAEDALRVAIVAPPWYPLPPRGYGGTELVVHLLHSELRRLGHDLTVYGAAGSEAGVTMLADAAWSHDLGGPDERPREATYLARVYADMANRRFDVIHDHAGFDGLLLALHSGVAPVVVHTIHGELVEPMTTLYK